MRTTLRADADTVREALMDGKDHVSQDDCFAALARLVEAAERTAEACSLCGIPRATGECSHIIQRDGRVTMSERAWERLVEELARLCNAEAEATDAQV